MTLSNTLFILYMSFNILNKNVNSHYSVYKLSERGSNRFIKCLASENCYTDVKL